MEFQVPEINEDGAVDILSQLLEAYQQPAFQVKLYNTYARYDASTLAYHERLRALFGAVRAGVLAKYGFTEDKEGDVALSIALSKFHNHAEVQILTASIEELLSVEATVVKDSKNLNKLQILKICRAQIVAFGDADFQRNLQMLKQEDTAAAVIGCAKLKGRDELMLTVQRPILNEYGLEANDRGVHSLFHQVAQHIMDPEVATSVTAINALLGMDAHARASFKKRLMDISVEDPCPKSAKVEVGALLKQIRTKSKVEAAPALILHPKSILEEVCNRHIVTKQAKKWLTTDRMALRAEIQRAERKRAERRKEMMKGHPLDLSKLATN